MSKQDRRNVAIPADEAADFVVSKPHVAGSFQNLAQYTSVLQWL
jgi:hypothetical protein